MQQPTFAAAATLLIAAAAIFGAQANQQQDLTNGGGGADNRKCVPIFGSSNRPTTAGNGSSSDLTLGQRLQDHTNNANFSFRVGDIDLPLVVPTEGSATLQSAMKLLSAFSHQFDQIMPGGEEDDDGDAQEDADDDDRLSNVVKFRDNRLHLSGLNVSMLNVHLYADGSAEPKFGIGLTIKNTTLDGRFIYKGPLAQALSGGGGGSNSGSPLSSSTGNALKGYYSMSIDNIYLLVSSNLTTSRAPLNESTPTARQSAARLQTSEFKLNVTNLGYISIDIYDQSKGNGAAAARQPTSNYVLKMLQKVLQRTIKRTYLTFEQHIRRALELEGRRALDCELTRFDDMLRAGTNTTTTTTKDRRQQDDLARVLDHEIVQSGFSRVELPDFDHQQSVFGGSTARISFYNGSLSGLNSIKMLGETRIKLQDQHLIMNTSLGWLELKPYYNWNLTLGSSSSSRAAPTSQGFVSFAIKDFDFDAVITKGLQDADPAAAATHDQQQQQQQLPKRRAIVVEQLVIRHLDTPKMDIGGLPGMNRLTRAIVNFFMGRLKQRLTGAIQPVLKQQLERSLNKLLVV